MKSNRVKWGKIAIKAMKREAGCIGLGRFVVGALTVNKKRGRYFSPRIACVGTDSIYLPEQVLSKMLHMFRSRESCDGGCVFELNNGVLYITACLGGNFNQNAIVASAGSAALKEALNRQLGNGPYPLGGLEGLDDPERAPWLR